MNPTRSKPIPAANEQESDLGKLRAFVDEAPDQPSAWIHIANALETAGRTAEALEAWENAERLVPDSALVSEAISRLGKEEAESPRAADFEQDAESTPTDNEISSIDRPDEGSPLDLDSLITNLQSGRREPTVEFEESEEPPDAVSDKDVVVSETLAGIYESQNHLAEAAEVYEALADREPNNARAETLRAKAADIRKRIA